jgi:hypothetical protein
MQRVTETFRARDSQGREYEVSVFGGEEAHALPGLGATLAGFSRATARLIGTDEARPVAWVEGDTYRIMPGDVHVTRIRA